jgi:hypothetical protein
MTITKKHIHPAGYTVFTVNAPLKKTVNVDKSIKEQFELLFGHDRISVLRYACTNIVEVTIMPEEKDEE